uniref:Uncharacterized protein n=1 Tax=Cyanistes caeruleus TaxID=156563 RepID=A0A8C0TYH3_CYACU
MATMSLSPWQPCHCHRVTMGTVYLSPWQPCTCHRVTMATVYLSPLSPLSPCHCHHNSAKCLLRELPWQPGVVRASSIFPILSAVLLLLGGLCVAASRLQRARTSLVLGAGILFVAAGTWGDKIPKFIPKTPKFIPKSIPESPKSIPKSIPESSSWLLVRGGIKSQNSSQKPQNPSQNPSLNPQNPAQNPSLNPQNPSQNPSLNPLRGRWYVGG